MMVKFDVVFFAVFFQVRKCGDVPCKLGVCKVPQLDRDCFLKLYYLPDLSLTPTNQDISCHLAS